MYLDPLDIDILRIFYNLKKNEETTTWMILKKIYPELKNKYEKESKHNLIKSRIRRMKGELFEIKKVDEKWIYSLIYDNIKFCKHKFPNGNKNCLMVFVLNKWNVFEL